MDSGGRREEIGGFTEKSSSRNDQKWVLVRKRQGRHSEKNSSVNFSSSSDNFGFTSSTSLSSGGESTLNVGGNDDIFDQDTLALYQITCQYDTWTSERRTRLLTATPHFSALCSTICSISDATASRSVKSDWRFRFPQTSRRVV